MVRTRTGLERNKAEVIKAIVLGESGREIARRFHVSEAAVRHFRGRHADEIQPAVAAIVRQTTDFAIAHQVNRVADAQLRRDLMEQARLARAAGGDGMETGIVARQYKMLGSGKNAQLVEEYKVDTAFLAEWRANDEYVANTLGQTPRAETNIHTAPTYVLQIIGASGDIPLG